MPKIGDCPNSIASTISFSFNPLDHVRCGGLITNSVMVWNGVNWTPSPTSGPVRVWMDRPGPGRQCTVHWEVVGCVSGTVGSTANCWGVLHNVGVQVPWECCPWSWSNPAPAPLPPHASPPRHPPRQPTPRCARQESVYGPPAPAAASTALFASETSTGLAARRNGAMRIKWSKLGV